MRPRSSSKSSVEVSALLASTRVLSLLSVCRVENNSSASRRAMATSRACRRNRARSVFEGGFLRATSTAPCAVESQTNGKTATKARLFCRAHRSTFLSADSFSLNICGRRSRTALPSSVSSSEAFSRPTGGLSAPVWAVNWSVDVALSVTHTPASATP